MCAARDGRVFLVGRVVGMTGLVRAMRGVGLHPEMEKSKYGEHAEAWELLRGKSGRREHIVRSLASPPSSTVAAAAEGVQRGFSSTRRPPMASIRRPSRIPIHGALSILKASAISVERIANRLSVQELPPAAVGLSSKTIRDRCYTRHTIRLRAN